MGITIKKTNETFTRDQLKVLAARRDLNEMAKATGITASELDQSLTALDFQNRVFADWEDLAKGVFVDYTRDIDFECPVPELIEMAHPSARIVLYRGCNQTDANQMRQFMSAGGVAANQFSGPPSEADVIGQVGEGQYKVVAGRMVRVKLPEFTQVAPRSGGAGAGMMSRVRVAPGVVMGIVKVKILRKYLVIGDKGCMQGWCTNYNAPLHEWVSFTRR